MNEGQQLVDLVKAPTNEINQGQVAIEQSRAVAEALGKLQIAKQFPRDEAQSYAKAMDACKRFSLAETAIFSYPRGGKNVSGPSIRLAETLARCYGNIEFGLRELSRKQGSSEMEAWCIDLQSNTTSKQQFTVAHIRDKKGGGVKLKEERDLYEITANQGARRLRARIMAILPPDLIDGAVDQCKKTLSGNSDVPLIDRVRGMTTRFESLGITNAMLTERLGHSLAETLPDEFVELTQVYQSLKQGMTTAKDWFGSDNKEASKQVEALTSEPEKKPEVAEPEVLPADDADGEVF